MYHGAWVYPGLKPGYHSSVMNSSTGMTVAIAAPRAGWTPMSRRFHCRFALATSAFLPGERYGLPREPTMPDRGKTSASARSGGPQDVTVSHDGMTGVSAVTP